MATEIARIQQKLKDLGFNNGEVDGVWGRATIAATRQFQRSRGLAADGIVGPKTRAALFGPAAAPPASSGSDLVWFQEALHLVGTTEKPGSGNNPDILQWAKDLDIDYAGDDIPWCGLFVAHCIGATLPDETLPSGPLGARNWRRFGERCQPTTGAVLVFWRGSPSGSLGHVGFYHGEDSEAYHVLGGNQSDAVNRTRIAKGRLLDARWPITAAELRDSAPAAASSSLPPLAHKPLSTNEQ